jgi:hypothetical protein
LGHSDGFGHASLELHLRQSHAIAHFVQFTGLGFPLPLAPIPRCSRRIHAAAAAAGHNGVHTAGDGGRPAGDAELQPHVPAGELPDEVLLLPHPVVAAAALRRGGLQQEDRRVRAGQDGGGGGGVPRPYHVPGRAAHAPQVRVGHKAHDGGAAVHAGRVRGRVCVAARAQEQPRRVPSLY